MNYKFKLVIEGLDKGIPTDGEAPKKGMTYGGECKGYELSRRAQEVKPKEPFGFHQMFEPGGKCVITLFDCAVETINQFE